MTRTNLSCFLFPVYIDRLRLKDWGWDGIRWEGREAGTLVQHGGPSCTNIDVDVDVDLHSKSSVNVSL